jgi:hypothetical protein
MDKQKVTRKAERGVALIMVVILTVVIAILIGGITDAVIYEFHSAGVNGVSNVALSNAYSGIDDVVLQLGENTSGKNVSVPTPIATSVPGDGWFNGSYTAQVDYQFPTTGSLNYFLVSATGTAGAGFLGANGSNGITRSLYALVRTVPYSAYEMYSVSETNNVGGKVWYANGQHYDGPVYSGGPMNILYADGDSPIFGSTIETGQNINWDNFTTGQLTGPQDTADWNSVLNGGQSASSNISVGVPPKPLPTFKDNLLVASEAWNGTSAPFVPAQPPQELPGLYINGSVPTNGSMPLTTGIYISGNVTVYAQGSACPVSCVGTGNQEFIFQTQAGNYDVTVNFSGDTTTVTGPGGTTTYAGVASGQPAGGSGGNGSIFVDGNVTVAGGIGAGFTPNAGVNATVHGQYTLAVPDYGSSSPLSYSNMITLKKSVLYDDNPTTDSSSTDVLAMWANNIQVTDNADATFEVDALMLTGYNGECTGPCNSGTFSNSTCGVGACGGGANRVLTIYGSLVENVRGKLGTQVYGANGCATGFCRHMGYDKRLGSNPPPFSPTTNKYEITAITETPDT